ncbi:hypothetical protein A2U01_0061827, partial [Trifolium medium]|nr:hypothetical protein [Trifolium medium]
LTQRATGEPRQRIPGSLASNGEHPRSARLSLAQRANPEFRLGLGNLPWPRPISNFTTFGP